MGEADPEKALVKRRSKAIALSYFRKIREAPLIVLMVVSAVCRAPMSVPSMRWLLTKKILLESIERFARGAVPASKPAPEI